MSLVIDTGVLYAHHDEDAGRHQEAMDALTEILGSGGYGQPFFTDYIYDEVITLTRFRMNNLGSVLRVEERLLKTDALNLEHITTEIFEKALDVFKRYSDHQLSFTDAATIALVDKRNLDYVLSFNDDFDGLVNRLNPEDI